MHGCLSTLKLIWHIFRICGGECLKLRFQMPKAMHIIPRIFYNSALKMMPVSMTLKRIYIKCDHLSKDILTCIRYHNYDSYPSFAWSLCH